MLHPAVLECRPLDHIGNRMHPPVLGELVQDDPDHQPARDGQAQHPIPRHGRGEAVQHGHVIGAIEKGLQRLDPLAEEQRRKARRDPDHQRDQPELELAGTTVAQDAPRPRDPPRGKYPPSLYPYRDALRHQRDRIPRFAALMPQDGSVGSIMAMPLPRPDRLA